MVHDFYFLNFVTHNDHSCTQEEALHESFENFKIEKNLVNVYVPFISRWESRTKQWFMKTEKMNVFLLIVAFLWKCTGFEFRRHTDPVKAVYGKAAILPCVVKGQINIDPDKVIVTWDYYSDRKYPVHYYYRGANKVTYENRTTLPEESEIRKGNVSLIMERVTKNDERTYNCEMDMNGDSKATTVKLVVSVPLSGHNIVCYPQWHHDTNTYSINVTCEAIGEKDISLSWKAQNNTGSNHSVQESKSDWKKGQTKVTVQFVVESAKPGEVVDCTAHNRGEESTRSCPVPALPPKDGVRHLGLIGGMSLVVIIACLLVLFCIYQKKQ
uniref:cell surface A33 antigen-like isoform X2 n=1 Tax=Myxine glutinosa TaxID=7769 RepID=UPI00358EBFAD